MRGIFRWRPAPKRGIFKLCGVFSGGIPHRKEVYLNCAGYFQAASRTEKNGRTESVTSDMSVEDNKLQNISSPDNDKQVNVSIKYLVLE